MNMKPNRHQTECPNTLATSTNVCIKCLPAEFTKTDLVSLCNQFGKIQSAKVMIDLKTGISKCFGFVRFDSFYAASLCISNLNGMSILNKKLIASFAGSTENTGNSSNSILVRSLPLFYSRKDIWLLFSKFGDIININMKYNNNNNNNNQKDKNYFHGACVITYKTVCEAEEALKQLNNIKLYDDSWPLFIQFTEEPKSFQQEEYYNNNNNNANVYYHQQKFQFEKNSFIKYGIDVKKPKNSFKLTTFPKVLSEEEANKKNNQQQMQTFHTEKTNVFEDQNKVDNVFYGRKQRFDDLMFRILAEEL